MPKLGIATSFDSSYKNYILACEELGVPYQAFDILAPDWIETVAAQPCDGYLLRPPCDFAERKALYDERIYFLNKELHKPIYPGFEELFLYENKRNVSYWLKINGFPHMPTKVFTRKQDAVDYLSRCAYPVVIKANTGSGSKRVSIVDSKTKALFMAHRAFGLLHPDHALGLTPDLYFHGKRTRLPFLGAAQRHYLLVQEYCDIRWEWRIIKIGDSYFGHQKLLRGRYASGSQRVGWVEPPHDLLRMVKAVAQAGGFHSLAMDVFERRDGAYFINELQSLFGSYDDSQMYIDGVPGRFVERDGAFVFEQGRFNRFGSYLLRVEHFLSLLAQQRG